MRLYEIEDQSQDEEGVDFDPLMPDVESLILRLEASRVQKVRVEDFIEELNNVLNVPIDLGDVEEINNVKQLISNTGKAEIKGEYVLVNYQTPKSPGETDTQKIAMKNVKDNAS